MGGLRSAVPGMDLEWITGSVEGSEVASDLKVFITRGEASCEECGEDLGRRSHPPGRRRSHPACGDRLR